MTYLLSTAALNDLIVMKPAIIGLVDSVGPQSLHISVISAGVLAAAIDELGPADPRRYNLSSNLNKVMRQAQTFSGVRDVSLPITEHWATIANLPLANSRGMELGVESTLVIATAMVSKLTLVTPGEPWIPTLQARGLDVHIYQ